MECRPSFGLEYRTAQACSSPWLHTGIHRITTTKLAHQFHNTNIKYAGILRSREFLDRGQWVVILATLKHRAWHFDAGDRLQVLTEAGREEKQISAI